MLFKYVVSLINYCYNVQSEASVSQLREVGILVQFGFFTKQENRCLLLAWGSLFQFQFQPSRGKVWAPLLT